VNAPDWRQDESLLCSIDDPAEGAIVSGGLLVRGWGRRPGEDLMLSISVDGEEREFRTLRRTPRPDVLAAFPRMGDVSHAGYEATIAMRPDDAKEHSLVIVFWTRDGRFRRYPPRRFTWRP
jgi:hypothetical protein